jgi:Type VI secretion system, TssO
MSQVLNAKDRNQAFLKFLLFFLATIILAIFAVYFDFRLPVRENKMLQDEINEQRQIDLNQEKFVSTMQEASVLIDSMDKAGPNLAQINLQLNQKLIDLNGLQLKDNSLSGKMDAAIVDKFLSLQQAKTKLQSLSEKENKISSMEADLNETKAQLQQAQIDLDAYRRGAK